MTLGVLSIGLKADIANSQLQLDPHSILGAHIVDGQLCIRALVPGAEEVDVIERKSGEKVANLSAVMGAWELFEGVVSNTKQKLDYFLRARKGEHEWDFEDPYHFDPVLGELDEHLFSEGSHHQLWDVLGAHVINHQGVDGVHFAVWAPNASHASVVGNFNGWNGRLHRMRRAGSTGIWEIFVPGLSEGETYKYELTDAHGTVLPQKADPVGFGSEHPPKTASVVRKLDTHTWDDKKWMSKRDAINRFDQPITIYEVQLGSWRRVPEEGNRALSYEELAEQLVAYAKNMRFTHIELMPISEFPFDGSWGYQPVGMYAPTIRHGTLDEFRHLVEACHKANIGIIIDWVPGHFPEDKHGLGKFDGTALYEHADPKEGFHPDWNTLVFNYGRREVSNYLIANALYWLKEYHIDGLRVDAVASMLYRDYSRKEGEWIPNIHGGRENLEAIEFMQNMNATVYGNVTGIMTMAEESTAFPGVSAPTDSGGLGFGFKWNMGWMNDTLRYMAEDPIHRKYHHQQMTFGIHYAFTENFVLPLSHDEVVHGKGSLLEKMPGDYDDKFANLRAYYGFMWGHPGKKLLFMGCEFAQWQEWNHSQSLDWHLLDEPKHLGIQNLIRDLNALYQSSPALYQNDCKPEGFEWVEENAEDESLFIWLRKGQGKTKPVLVVSNFTPIERSSRRVGVPEAGRWIEKLNTDSEFYGGHGRGNMGLALSEDIPSTGQAHSISITIPPLATLFFELE